MGCANSRNQNTKNLLIQNQNDEIVFKVVMLGRHYVGKTSILEALQFNNEIEDDSYKPTIGLAFSQKIITLKNGVKVNLHLWDTSGDEKYRDLTSLYYRDANAAILVFSYDEADSLDSLGNWIEELGDRINCDDIIIKIAANKHDLYDKCEKKILHEDILHKLKDFDSNKFEIFDTSAKTGKNIHEIFEKIAQDCYQRFHSN